MSHLLHTGRILSLVFLSACSVAQNSSTTNQAGQSSPPRRPKLIVGITVDQMRYDYIERFWNDLSDDGFKKLVNEGFFARNLHYNYMPTYTGPGHAAIFTGTTPAFNGIIANDWYERATGNMVYCSADSTVHGVGTSLPAGKMSPHYLTSTTLGDELKLFSNQRSKVIGIAMKDRGATLPAGRTADAAYWFIGSNEGNWATSSWYMNDLPQWVKDYNAQRIPDQYINSSWNLLLDPAQYDESIEDNNAFEMPFKGLTRPVFPYDLNTLRELNGNYELLKATPFGNALTVDFAKAVLKNEKMGQDEFTDMLCMSFSSTDYIGHQFGIHSKEVQDCYLRLDRELAAFIHHLDETVGKGNYLIFLSADHAGAPTPSYVMERKGAAGYWKSDRADEVIQNYLTGRYGAGNWIIHEVNQNIFLNRALIREKNLSLKSVQAEVTQVVSEMDNILMAFSGADLDHIDSKSPIASKVQLGYNQRLSGDVIYVTNPGYMENGMQGTTHGSPFTYDTHVPALFYGFGVKKGETFHPYTICDIIPTIASLCRLPLPSAAIGQPIYPLVD